MNLKKFSADFMLLHTSGTMKWISQPLRNQHVQVQFHAFANTSMPSRILPCLREYNEPCTMSHEIGSPVLRNRLCRVGSIEIAAKIYGCLLRWVWHKSSRKVGQRANMRKGQSASRSPEYVVRYAFGALFVIIDVIIKQAVIGTPQRG